jgi:hypothetical protein
MTLTSWSPGITHSGQSKKSIGSAGARVLIVEVST